MRFYLGKRLTLIILTLLLMFQSAGCSSRISPEARGNVTPEQGGSVVVAVPQDPDFLDPHQAAASGTYEMMFNVFEGLMKPDEKGQLQPALAREYSIADKGLTYIFKLREGVKFHNGKTVTVSDVRYSLERLAGLNGQKALSSSFKVVKKVEIPDNSTIVVRLKKPDASFLSNCTEAVLPKDNPDHNKKPIGTGPFKFVEYVPAQRLVLEKFQEYWQKGVPYLDSVEFRIIPDSEAALLSFKAGEVDMYPRIDNERIGELGPAFHTVQGMQNMIQLLAFNMKRKPFDDIRVRKAISYAIDTELIIKGAAAGCGTKLGSAMSPAMYKFYEPGLEDTYKKNIAAAEELLAEVGVDKGFRAKLTVPSNYKLHVDTAQIIADQLDRVGIHISIEQVEWGVWLDRVYKGRDYDMTVVGLAGKLDPHKVLNRYASTNPANFFNYNSPQYDELINGALGELGEGKRVEFYRKAQRHLVKEAASVFIMDPSLTVAMRTELAGYKMYPVYVQDMSSIYFKE